MVCRQALPGRGGARAERWARGNVSTADGRLPDRAPSPTKTKTRAGSMAASPSFRSTALCQGCPTQWGCCASPSPSPIAPSPARSGCRRGRPATRPATVARHRMVCRPPPVPTPHACRKVPYESREAVVSMCHPVQMQPKQLLQPASTSAYSLLASVTEPKGGCYLLPRKRRVACKGRPGAQQSVLCSLHRTRASARPSLLLLLLGAQALARVQQLVCRQGQLLVEDGFHLLPRGWGGVVGGAISTGGCGARSACRHIS